MSAYTHAHHRQCHSVVQCSAVAVRCSVLQCGAQYCVYTHTHITGSATVENAAPCVFGVGAHGCQKSRGFRRDTGIFV